MNKISRVMLKAVVFFSFIFIVFLIPLIFSGDSGTIIMYNFSSLTKNITASHVELIPDSESIHMPPPMNILRNSTYTYVDEWHEEYQESDDSRVYFTSWYENDDLILFYANVSEFDNQEITLINWTWEGCMDRDENYTCGGIACDTKSFFYIWNDNSQIWEECAVPFSSNTESQTYCNISHNTYNYKNDTNHIHFLNYINATSDTVNLCYEKIDLVKLEITYNNATPTYSNIQNNASIVTKVNGFVNFSIDIADNYLLSNITARTNITGNWESWSKTLSGISDSYSFINQTNLTRGNYICTNFTIADSLNQLNNTNHTCFTVVNSNPTLETDLKFYNYTTHHWFNVTATFSDNDKGTDINTSTIETSSGTCKQLVNTTSGNDFSITFNCSGTALTSTTIRINVTDLGSALINSSQKINIYPNNAPTMVSVELNKTFGVVDTNDLNCSAVGASDDDPEDTATYHYEWYNDSIAIGQDTVWLSNTNLTDGDTWYCEAWVSDTYENSSKYTSSSVIIGSSETAPSIDFTNATTASTGINSTANNPTNNNSWINFSTTFTDADTNNWTAYFCDTPTWSTCQANASGEILCMSPTNSSNKTLNCKYTVGGLSTGSKTYYTFVLDSAFLVSTSVSNTYNINLPPTIPSLVEPLNNSYHNHNQSFINFTATDGDNDLINYTIFGNETEASLTKLQGNNLSYYNWTGLADSVYYINAFTTDEHSYSNTNSSTYQFTIDTTFPTLTVSSPTTSIYYSKEITLTQTATDTNIDKCFYSVITGSSVEISNTPIVCSNTTTFTVSLWASYTLNVSVNDSAGNMNSTQINFTTQEAATSPGGGSTAPSKPPDITQAIAKQLEEAPICGNGVCQPGESPLGCPEDCRLNIGELFCWITDIDQCSAWVFNFMTYTLLIVPGVVMYRKQTKNRKNKFPKTKKFKFMR